MSGLVKQQIVAARETAKALAGLLDGLLAEMERQEQVAASVCQHPPEKRIPSGVMGNPDRYICGVCRATVSSTGARSDNVALQEG